MDSDFTRVQLLTTASIHGQSARRYEPQPAVGREQVAGQQHDLGPRHGPDQTGAATHRNPLGEAFQLRDDVLGAFGDPGKTGKPADDDLRACKPTMLLALAREKATPAQARELAAMLVHRPIDDPERLRELIVETGALATVEEMITRRTAQALARLEESALPDDVCNTLAELAIAATRRAA